MDTEVKQEMNTYYNERAQEYDEFYLEGMGPASIDNPGLYKEETQELQKVLGKENLQGTVYDICCGTAFWLPSYYKNTAKILLTDQAENMIGKAKERAFSLGCIEKCSFHVVDAFDIASVSEKDKAHTIFSGFFISHLTEEQGMDFFRIMKSLLIENGKIIIFDSTWNEEREKVRIREGLQERILNNGDRFKIYKKYFTEEDLEKLSERENLSLSIQFFGRTFFAAVFERR